MRKQNLILSAVLMSVMGVSMLASDVLAQSGVRPVLPEDAMYSETGEATIEPRGAQATSSYSSSQRRTTPHYSRGNSSHYEPSLLEVARRYDSRGNKNRAMEYYQKYLLSHKDDLPVTLRLASLMYDAEEYDEAKVYYERALRLAPQRGDLQYHLGLIYTQLDQPDMAIPHYLTALNQDPDNLDVITNLGYSYLRMGALNKAITSFFRAAEMDPLTAERHNMLGMTYLKANMLEDAVLALKEAVRLAPKEAAYNFNLAEAYQQIGDTDKAYAQYDNAVQSETVTGDDKYTQGKVYYRMGLYDDAIKSYRRALWDTDDKLKEANTHLALGYAYEANGQQWKAKNAFQNYLKIVPDGENADNVRVHLRSLDEKYPFFKRIFPIDG